MFLLRYATALNAHIAWIIGCLTLSKRYGFDYFRALAAIWDRVIHIRYSFNFPRFAAFKAIARFRNTRWPPRRNK